MFKVKYECTVRDLGRSIRSDNLSVNDVANLIHLLASILQMDDNDDPTVNRYPIHRVMPVFMKKICDGSRVHGGLRLLKRAARHATFFDEPDVRDSIISIGIHRDSNIFIRLKNTVAASYQQKSDRKFYNNEVIITANDLLGCMCDCKVGARVRGKCSVVGYDDRNKKTRLICNQTDTFVYMGPVDCTNSYWNIIRDWLRTF